ncbi:hypothetical protein GCM10017691_29040 [Pseudonocardia petroleophila]|uniref:Gfo/Idh/MocA family protein n=1 Tax=Pseudonocardia petroleophila TaxID=37331 RepID=UPI0021020E83|nr:Gfo/Idh/MocA family oxidoreductase [Pseudonocardia petroleophila]
MSGPLRIGILGAARITGQALVDPAKETGDRLVAVAARDPRRAEAFAAEHGVERVVGSYADVLVDPEVEIVYNPLANALHGPWNLAAVAAGKHVLSEKPFASNAAEARAVRDAAAAAGVVVLEGFHHAHHPVLLRLHELVASGELGALRRVEARFTMPAPPDDDPRWRLDLAGGALMDLGCYPLQCLRSFARWAGGEPSVSSATAGERAGHPGVDERVTAELGYPSGATGAGAPARRRAVPHRGRRRRAHRRADRRGLRGGRAAGATAGGVGVAVAATGGTRSTPTAFRRTRSAGAAGGRTAFR